MKKVLIIEDNSLIRLWYKRRFRSLGWAFTPCQDAATALAACQHTCYPLILCDVELPDMDGLELCRRIRSLPHGANSIILLVGTGSTPENIRAAIEAGANGYLAKPLSSKQFGPKLSDSLRMSSVMSKITKFFPLWMNFGDHMNNLFMKR